MSEHKFKKGDIVIWEDPDPIEGQIFKAGKITSIQHQGSDAVISVEGTDGSEFEAFAHELCAHVAHHLQPYK